MTARCRVSAGFGLILGCMLCLVGSARAAPPPLLDFSADEVRRILAHGPWPSAPVRDPGNAVAGTPQAVALGKQLFFDKRLSPDARLSCASCHVPALALGDGRPKSLGRVLLDRNAPSLINAGRARWLGWDGAADSLWGQATRPLLDAREMASSGAHLRALVTRDPHYAQRWHVVFGGPPQPQISPDLALVQVTKAIGAYVGTLTSGRTAFDEFRDALARDDHRTAAKYPLPAQRGLRLFVGRARCATCHVGPLFSNGEFADIGLPFFVRPGVVDPGRHGGIAALHASPFNLLGPWSDVGADDDSALKTRHVLAQPRNFGEFKVPPLRNVARTAPYMHDGQLATLHEVVRHYDQIKLERLHADGERILQPLHLTAQERADIVAFLRSLSDLRAVRRLP